MQKPHERDYLFIEPHSLPLPIDLVIYVYTNKQMLVGVYLDPRQSSTTSKSAESRDYEAFVVVLQCQLKLFQLLILTNKQDRVTIITIFVGTVC